MGMPSILRLTLKFFNVQYTNNEFLNFIDIFTKIILILIIIKLARHFSNYVIGHFFEKQKSLKFGMSDKKSDTLSELFKSIVQYGLYFVAIISVFQTIWPNANFTIALTSVLGVALGFGSQNLVKDIISGLFILFEDQYAVGDYITIEGKSGIVEAVGIRTTKIRDFSGDLHVIPNGSITSVTNKTRSDMRALVDINIAYGENVDKAIEILDNVGSQMKVDYDTIADGPNVAGVVALTDSGIVLRITAKTYPLEQFGIECELRKRIVKEFGLNNIRLGYNRKIVFEEGVEAVNDKQF